MDFEPLSIAYGAASAKVAAAKAELEKQSAKVATLRSEMSEAKLEMSRLLDLDQQDHVKRLLDGEKAAPRKPKRLTRITNLKEQIAGLKLALPIQDERVREAERKLAEAQQKAGEAIIPGILEQKSTLLKGCADPLEDLLAALIEVAAFDDVQRHFSGANGSIVLSEALQRDSLFSAQALLKKFRQNLPDRFKALANDTLLTIDEKIGARSKSIINQIGG